MRDFVEEEIQITDRLMTESVTGLHSILTSEFHTCVCSHPFDPQLQRVSFIGSYVLISHYLVLFQFKPRSRDLYETQLMLPTVVGVGYGRVVSLLCLCSTINQRVLWIEPSLFVLISTLCLLFLFLFFVILSTQTLFSRDFL